VQKRGDTETAWTLAVALKSGRWQRGRVLEVVTLFGPHVSKARLMALAKRQDTRLTHPTFGDA
jgi:hypothetical protein